MQKSVTITMSLEEYKSNKAAIDKLMKNVAEDDSSEEEEEKSRKKKAAGKKKTAAKKPAAKKGKKKGISKKEFVAFLTAFVEGNDNGRDLVKENNSAYGVGTIGELDAAQYEEYIEELKALAADEDGDDDGDDDGLDGL